ncbi:MAG TPA: ELM1/GtrOC1 family putative glycosyltransferase, partial [bacterium]|nr:ELM1/GtrOC1 family putative glycosyltransferase [bacterium]
MNILVLDDGFKGNLNQSLGIAEAFPESRIEILKVSLKGPYYRLFQRKGKSPFVSRLFALSCCIRAWSLGRRLLQFFCDGNIEIPREKSYVIVSAGSILAPVNLILSKNQERAVSVNVMVPTSLPLKLFDFLVIPCHDYIKLQRKRLKNLIVTLGAPNRITETFISGEKKRIEKLLNFDNGKKNIGILIGGNDQNYRISLPLVKRLADILFSCDGKYSFLFTTSRRTETCVVNYLVKRLEKEKSVVYSEFPGYSDISYYPGILGLCDCILVTEDSINMISEAARIQSHSPKIPG